MLYKIFQEIEKGNFYLHILWGKNYSDTKITQGYLKKDIKYKGWQMEDYKFSEHSRKYREEELARGLKSI